VAQEVPIPDPGLQAAIRETLQKPLGPLTQQDLLNLTQLSACCRSIRSVEGLQAARNLRIVDLTSNSITNFPFAGTLTNLEILDLFQNNLTSFAVSNALPKLNILDLGFNSLAQCSLPGGLTNLDTLFLEGNQLTSFSLPTNLTRMTQLDLSGNRLTSFTFPPDATNLFTALVFANRLTNVTLHANLKRLNNLDLDFNQLRKLTLPSGLTNLISLTLLGNQLTNLTLPPDITRLGFLDLGANQLPDFTLPGGLTQLTSLRLNNNNLSSFAVPSGMVNLNSLMLSGNQLTNLTLPADLSRLTQIDLGENQLTSFTLPSGMTSLNDLTLDGNRLAIVTLPPDATNLVSLFVNGNPLTTFVLSQPIATVNLAGLVASLQTRHVDVHIYPPLPSLLSPHRPTPGTFSFTLTGPPGVYAILRSSNLTTWNDAGVVSNQLGSVTFTDTNSLIAQKFYRAFLPPANMVFVPPNTFTMGSPATDLDSSVNERPQTIVTLTRGFWIANHEVTEAEYLSLMNTNPSFFPDDLSRAVSSVSWLDATNYCAKLTERDLAAGRIPPGSHYRLPTEAEWECAARAGTSTRFSYGNDDPNYSSLPNYAWFSENANLMVHPVGQKIPNPWGLYDMHGNVWEWCLDWYGSLPGGSRTDPTGPASNVQGLKVMRGGAYDFPNSSCRSASRLFFAVSPFITDTDLGFRVVFVTGPQ
jgi:formylglycine-generating enzyme required for sulfatase activity